MTETQKLKTTKLLDIVLKEFNISKDDLLSHNRKEVFCFPRQIFIYLSVNEIGVSIDEISLFTSRHRDTITNSINKIADMLFYKKDLRQTISEIKNSLNAIGQTEKKYFISEFSEFIKWTIDNSWKLEIENIEDGIWINVKLRSYKTTDELFYFFLTLPPAP